MTQDKADPHLPHALRILARDIHCEDGIATQCIREAAEEIDRLRLAAEEREAVERMTPDTSEMSITTRLRQTRANMLGTADEDHYWDCHAAADEIERLRLTEEEREAIELVAEAYSDKAADAYAHNEDDHHYSQIAATLRGLLGRLSGNGDCLAPDNATIRDNSDRSQPIAKCDATPPSHTTPEECTVPTQWREDVGK